MHGAGPLYAGAGRLGRRPARRLRAARSTCAGRAGRWATSWRETGRDAVDVICDLLLAEDLRVNQVTPGPHTDGIRPFVAHPVGDGRDGLRRSSADKPRPRTYGSLPADPRPVRARGAAAGARGGGSQDDRRAPAARLGLRDRGVLADGSVADLVVFDPATVRIAGDLRRAAAVPRSGSST